MIDRLSGSVLSHDLRLGQRAESNSHSPLGLPSVTFRRNYRRSLLQNSSTERRCRCIRGILAVLTGSFRQSRANSASNGVAPDACANRCVGAMAGERTIRRCAYVFAAISSFSVNGAIGQESADANPRGNVADHASPTTEQHLPLSTIRICGSLRRAATRCGEFPLAHFPSRRNGRSFPRATRRRPRAIGAAPDAGCRSSAAASRTGAASANACGNRDRQSAKSCAHSQPDDRFTLSFRDVEDLLAEPRQERTEPSGHRPCRQGVKSSLRREPEVPGDSLRAIFGNLTEPFGDFYVLGLPKASY